MGGVAAERWGTHQQKGRGASLEALVVSEGIVVNGGDYCTCIYLFMLPTTNTINTLAPSTPSRPPVLGT